MILEQIKPGSVYTYYPAQGAGDNIHFRAEVLDVKKRVKVKLDDGREVCVSAKSLLDQLELIG